MVNRYTHDPQTYLNGYISMMRNMFVTSSISLVVLGFSTRFKENERIGKVISILIMIYSISYGVISAIHFSKYIDHIENTEELRSIYEIQISQWKRWIILTYVYIVLLIIIIGLMIGKVT